mgnify:CR=1 FL=1
MTNNYETDIEEINEKYEDRVFRLAMNLVAEKEGELFLKENERLNSEDGYMLTEKALIRFSKKLNRQLVKFKWRCRPIKIVNKVTDK